MRRALLIFVVTVISGGALAQPAVTAVRQATRTWTEEQILANVTGNAITKPTGWGRLVRYGGGLVLAGTFVYSALEWFYDQAQRATGTSMDDWWHWAEAGWEQAYVLYEPRTSGGGGGCTGPRGVSSAAYVRKSPETGLSALWTGRFGVQCGLTAQGAQNQAYAAAATHGDGSFALQEPGYWKKDETTTGVVERYWWIVGEPRPDLETFLRNNPSAMRGVQSQILPARSDQLTGDPNFPYTYGEPAPGVEIHPAPNINQWYDNPFADPTLDTDGDGWPDWKEVLAGTDPLDPDHFPAVDPAPEPEPGQDPLPDTDGDGIPDVYDPCPFDALNRCADTPEELEIPDDYAREITLQGIANDAGATRSATERTADAAEAIQSLLEGEGEITGEPVMPELEAAWDGVVTRLQNSLETIRMAATGKVGFNAGSLIPQLTASGGGSCEEITITLLGIVRPLGWCGSSFYTLVTTWGRNGIALIMLIGFAFASARTIGAL